MELTAQKIEVTEGAYKGFKETRFFKKDGALYAIMPAHMKQPPSNARYVTLNGSYHRISWKEPQLRPKKKFLYLGMWFTPLRQLTAEEKRQGLNLPFRSIGISNYKDIATLSTVTCDYDYDEFYKAAARTGAATTDVFMWRGKEVVPCTNEIFELSK